MYHAHIYFDHNQVRAAEQLHDKIAQHKAAKRVFPLVHREVGPHSKPMFEVHFTEDKQGFVSWLDSQRGELSALIHPVSDDALSDHTTKALWLGKVLPIKTDILF
ncbi:4,5-dioxygenase [Photobacterium gaetbulicola]|uniref:Aromatic ring-cleaving dioxygenase n=1 Tax=Photobacterium gaetbulicola Gung47 TaxID=658445 RepID=A0A0C5WMK0_9GAMM|nr:DOPA 4,5-dioxygenase family protein [Photobacterium gaetbulicola]AJR06269.1 aromatic ring-cleaving dioxygenase [Photobacterium gaetbulicola Gung47]PSU08786.1 4,5-dioxygenase [Photobacterium gaetbulicola]